jgi:ribosomal peptide maturation radical SAM protein 1
MPFSGVDRPQIGLGLLQAELRARGIACSTVNFNLTLADWVGPTFYQWYSDSIPHTVFAGEWVFANAYFGDWLLNGSDYLRYLREDLLMPDETIRAIQRMREFVEPFLDYCVTSVDWSRYAIVGFTSTFEQNIASLALANAIKERYPEVTIVMGGANCEDRMGIGLHRCFRFLDYVFSGPADHTFPEFVQRLLRGDTVTSIPGLIYRDGDRTVYTGAPPAITNLDALPVPDYDDFFQQAYATSIPAQVPLTLQVETSRGCWWGEKHHCLFCGLNSEYMQFRAKNKDRALAEILQLVKHHGVRQVAAVDNIMDMHYFRDLLPELKERRLGLHLFYETKANLTKEQVRLLSEAGVKMIQPGIESFHSKILHLMRKGVSPLQCAQLLKWCKEFGVHPSWNLLYGFPGESAQDYEEMLPLLESLVHLPAPSGSGQIRLDRFSPYFDNPSAFGMINVRPLKIYRHLYPLSEADLTDIAYFFDFDYEDGLQPYNYIGPVEAQLDRWRQAEAAGVSLEMHAQPHETLSIVDRRPTARQPRTTLRGWEREVYEFCDQTRGIQTITQWRTEAKNEVPDETTLRAFLDHLVDLRLMGRDGDRYLSLAVPVASSTLRADNWMAPHASSLFELPMLAEAVPAAALASVR